MKLPPHHREPDDLVAAGPATALKSFSFESDQNPLPPDNLDSLKSPSAKKKRVRISHTIGTNYRTTSELAKRWPVSIRTLENWRLRGAGPKFRKFGVKVVYHIDAIEAFENVHYPNLRAS